MEIITTNTRSLAELESIIERGLQSFVDVGNALLEIKVDKRYREAGHSTFENYCTSRWGISVRQGQRLVLAATTVEVLVRDLPEHEHEDETRPIGRILPARESQVRPLTSLPPSIVKKAWTAAVESADGGQPTAVQVQEAVENVVSTNNKISNTSVSERKPRRVPITDTARRLAADLDAMARRVARFCDDDRVRKNRGVLPKGLSLAIDRLQSELGILDDALLAIDDEDYEERRDKEREWRAGYERRLAERNAEESS